MDEDLESNRISLSIGFITAFLGLFLGADLFSGSKFIFVVKIYAFLSGSLFFFHLLFTAVKFKYTKEHHVNVGTSYNPIWLTNSEIEKFRRWSFDTGISCVFYAFSVPFYDWLFQCTDSIKTLFALVLILLTFQSFYLATGYFFKANFFRAIIFTLITLLLLGSTGLINNEAKKIIAEKNNQETGGTSDSTVLSGLVNFLAGKNTLSY